MFVETALRVRGGGFAPPTIICNNDQRFLVAEHLRAAGLSPRQIILEPVGRNTAGAIAIGVLSLAAENPDATVLVMPSDHLIGDLSAFHAALERGLVAAQSGYIVTFGITPTRPETGYGYIRRGVALPDTLGAHAIAHFVEKPDAKTAESFLQSGEYYWNGGILLFRASDLLGGLRQHAPKIIAVAEKAVAAATRDLDFLRLDALQFAAMPAVPIDRALMEKTDCGAVVPVNMGWNDMGSWQALWDTAAKTVDGNAVKGDVLMLDSRNSLVHSQDGILTAVVGLDDIVVVVTDDAVLVLDKGQAEKVKTLVERLEAGGRHEHLIAKTVYRPWGRYSALDGGRGYLVKRIVVNPGAALSLQYHHHRSEHWIVVEGCARVTRGEETLLLQRNESTYIKAGEVHRLENVAADPLVLIEVQTGDILSEDDIVRLDDRYGRNAASVGIGR